MPSLTSVSMKVSAPLHQGFCVCMCTQIHCSRRQKIRFTAACLFVLGLTVERPAGSMGNHEIQLEEGIGANTTNFQYDFCMLVFC